MQTKFNLTDYILNEAFTSSIIQNDILNEPSGFFKYVKNRNNKILHKFGTFGSKTEIKHHSVYTDALAISKQLTACIFSLFVHKKYNEYSWKRIFVQSDYMDKKEYLDPNNDPDNLLSDVYKKLSDSELIKINKKYLEDFELLKKKIKNLFNRPDGDILRMLLTARNSSNEYDNFDLMSLTDNNFKKYTVADIKKNVDNFDDWYKDRTTSLLFFNADGYFLGSTNYDELICVNPLLIKEKGKPAIEAPIVQKIKELQQKVIDGTNDITIIKTKCNYSNKILFWPIPHELLSPSKDNSVLYTLQHNLDVTDIIADRTHTKKMGKILYSASNVRQDLQWGYNNDDYVIAYKPDISLQATDKNHYLYDDKNRSNVDHLHKMRYDNFHGSISEQYYKNVYNEIYQLQPYRVGSSKQRVTVFNQETGKYEIREIDSYMKTSDVVWSNNIDRYVELCRQNYKKRIEQFKTIKGAERYICTYKTLIYDNQKKLANILPEAQKVGRQIKTLILNNAISPEDMRYLKSMLYGTMIDGIYLKLFDGKLPSISKNITGLQALINNCISVLASCESIYSTLQDKLKYYNDVNRNETPITYNYSQSLANQKNHAVSSAIDNLQKNIEKAKDIINKHVETLYFGDIEYIIEQIQKIISKY